MRKPYFESKFKVKLTGSERCNTDYLVAFYTYRDYGQIGGIFDVRKLLLSYRISNFMEKRHDMKWVDLHISLLVVEE
jgi:hypothetical protein